jgi:hypothetical protein
MFSTEQQLIYNTYQTSPNLFLKVLFHVFVQSPIFESSVCLRLTDEGTSPTVRSLLDRVYAQTIELSELLNTIEWLGFPAICCSVMGLLLDFGLWT